MIIKFSVENFKSIKDRQTVYFTAIGSDENLENNLAIIDEGKKLSVVKSLGIFGANASGKSNLLKALFALKSHVTNSHEYKLDELITFYDPNKLVRDNNRNIYLEIEFVAKDKNRYIYSIEYSDTVFLNEALYKYIGNSVQKKAKVFSRAYQDKIKFGSYYKGFRKFNLFPNQLVLSQADKMPLESLVNVFKYFKSLFVFTIHNTALDKSIITTISERLSQDKRLDSLKRNMDILFRAADTGIKSTSFKNMGSEESDKNIFLEKKNIESDNEKPPIIKTHHLVFNDKQEIVEEVLFDLEDESTGTEKLYTIGGFILLALALGVPVVIDELDKSLHPLITRLIISLFHSNKNNPNNAQLIFSSHDMTLIDKSLLRKDQIIVCDKNIRGSSTYTKLSEFKGLSKINNLQDWYLDGRFGGIPIVDEIELQFNES